MMRVAGSHLVQALVVICLYFLYGAGSVCLLDARRASGLILGMQMNMTNYSAPRGLTSGIPFPR